MPHAALWVVQPKVLPDLQGGRKVSMPHVAIPFRPHHRFAVPLPRSRRGGLVRLRFLAESRNISFPRRCGGSGERSEPIGAPMPHAALWVVQLRYAEGSHRLIHVSMPHAAIPFRPHHRFAVPLPRSRRGGFSFTACRLLSPMRGMRAAAKYRRSVKGYGILASPIAMGEVASAASRWGRSCRTRLCGWCSVSSTRNRFRVVIVSMPHAALWVVQLCF